MLRRALLVEYECIVVIVSAFLVLKAIYQAFMELLSNLKGAKSQGVSGKRALGCEFLSGVDSGAFLSGEIPFKQVALR